MNRLQNIQQRLVEEGADLFYFEHPTNLLYVTGLEMSTGRCVVGKDRAHLLVDSRYFEACRETSPIPVVLDEADALLDLLKNEYVDCRVFAFDGDNLSYRRGSSLQKSWAEKLNRPVEVRSVSDWVLDIRSVKDENEKEALRKAADLGSEGYDFVVSLLKEGITEQEVVTELDIFWKRKGARGCGFDPIIAFGPGSSRPHYHPGNVKLTSGVPVLIDIGVNLNGFHSDMTRVVFFGPPDPEIEKIYHIVLEAQEKALAACRPGVSVKQLDSLARDHIKNAGYGDFFGHGLGHGIGLDIHELPVLSSKPKVKDCLLKEGMAITIEPGIYLPGKGGVRIEDSVLVTEGGIEDLTKRPKEVRVIDAVSQ